MPRAEPPVNERLLRHPLRVLRQMFAELMKAREMAWLMMRRDITVQYRQSLLGILWAFAPPLVLAVGVTLAQRAGVVNLGETALPRPVYIFLSVALWQNFGLALNAPLNGLRTGRAMLTKISFPREVLLVAELGKVIFNFLIQSTFIIALFLYFQIAVSWTLLLFPFALLLLLLLGLTIGLFLAPIGALYKDVGNALGILMGAWMLITPVLYSRPEGSGLFVTIVNWNPVSSMLVTARELATGMPLTMLPGALIVIAATLLLLPAGLLFFRATIPIVVERWSS